MSTELARPRGRSSVIPGLGGRAAIISATRLLNRGLLLISPIILVRLLTVEDFGRYREFLLYTNILLSFSALGISSSLLRFVPERPELKWRFVWQATLMTLSSSVLVAIAALGLDAAVGGRAMGEYAVPAVIYVLLFVNLDFWEYLWLAEKRSLAVLGYTTGRLLARIITVVTAAAWSADVTLIIWSLVCLEAVRLLLSFVAWRHRAEPDANNSAATWREQLAYCLPFGGSMMLGSLNGSLGSLFITKILGPVALAHYAIGTYVHPVITVLRNSVSDVLLPEMVARARDAQTDRLLLFRRTTIVTAIFLLAAGAILARFAEVLILTIFSEAYRPAVLVLQIYLLTFVRECLDFGVPLRAINRTAPILHSNLLALVVNAVMLAVLMPRWGLAGAVTAFVISRVIEGIYLGRQLMRAYGAPLRAVAAWKDLFKVVIAAALAAVVLLGSFWTEHLGLAGVIVATVAYLAVFGACLVVLRVPEALLALRRLRPGVRLPDAR